MTYWQEIALKNGYRFALEGIRSLLDSEVITLAEFQELRASIAHRA